MNPSRAGARIRPTPLNLSTFVVLGVLLVAPGCALGRLATWIDWRVLVGGALALSFFAYLAYWDDKRRAEAGEWRTPESTLHLAALLGGWPGAFLGQRIFRHKTSKVSFLIVFWITVFAYEFLAVDFLLDWRLSGAALHALKA
ncbi:MAG: DUF1294 domain-containing protein [Opitutaceae bacterium]